jgi:hypothetical protein
VPPCAALPSTFLAAQVKCGHDVELCLCDQSFDTSIPASLCAREPLPEYKGGNSKYQVLAPETRPLLLLSYRAGLGNVPGHVGLELANVVRRRPSDRTREMRKGFDAKRCKQRPFAPDCTRGAPSPGVLAQEKSFRNFAEMRVLTARFRPSSPRDTNPLAALHARCRLTGVIRRHLKRIRSAFE